MNKLLTAIMVVFTLISCEESENVSSDLFTFVPSGSSYIISSSDLPSFLAQIDSSTVLERDRIQADLNITAIRNYTELLALTKTLMSFSKRDSISYDFLLIAEAKNDTLLINNNSNFSVESISTKTLDYKKITLDKDVTYSTFRDNILLASSSKELLEEVVKYPVEENLRSESFSKAISAASVNKASLFINHATGKPKNSKKKSADNNKYGSIAEWSVIDLDLNSNRINFNGISVSSSNSKNILEFFNKIQHQKNELQNVVPVSAKGFYSFTYNDFKNVSFNLKKFKNDSLVINDNSLLNFTKEAGVIYLNSNIAIAFNTTDAQLASESLPASEQILTEYRGISIYSSTEQPYLKFLEPLISSEGMKMYAFLDNFLVFTKGQSDLELIISNYQNNTTYSKQESFIDLQTNLAESSSLLFISTPKLNLDREKDWLAFQIQQDYSKYLSKDYNFSAIQFVKSEGFSHIHGSIKKSGNASNEEIQESTTISLPEAVSGNPFLYSISSRTNAIVYQDINNILHAVSSQGKTLWKKQLDSKILGDLQQIDLRRNGNQYLAFATLNNFFVIDNKGKAVNGFPLKFKDLITQPLSVFDYDNTRNYRFVITQKSKLLMYDAKGTSVNGFDFNGASSEITQPPKHIRIKNKDYIVVPQENGKLNILSRQGKERIAVKGKIDLAESAWYENNNMFVSISEDNNIIKIDSNGKISKQKLDGSDASKIVADEKVLVILLDNVLKINKKDFQLDYGLYTNPKLFKVGGKTYISLADTQAKKVYLFDQAGELLPDFPVYGVGVAGITSANKGKNGTALIIGEGNEVIFYSF